MLEFFACTFSNCVPLAVLIVSVIPTIESKIAIPFGMSEQIFGANALSPWLACLTAFAGGLIPIFLVMFVARKIKNKTTGFVCDKFLKFTKVKTQKYFEKFNTKTTVFKKCLYLCGFVAIPLPLTGVYTGSLIAGLSNLKLWQGFLSVAIGELLTCIGMTIICSLFENSAFYIFIMSLIFVGAVLLVNLVIFLAKKIRNKNKK